MAMGIFQQLDWLTTKVKRLCCAVEQIQQSGAGSYKVYTALLTQSGGSILDQLDETTPTQNVTKGVTYTIAGASDGDFLNVGAPNNNSGTSFVAINNNVPNSWGGSGAALIFDTGAPVVTVLENTIGNIYFSFLFDGRYSANSDSAFTLNKTSVLVGPLSNGLTEGFSIIDTSSNVSSIGIGTVANGGTYVNEMLYNTVVEIRVYN